MIALDYPLKGSNPTEFEPFRPKTDSGAFLRHNPEFGCLNDGLGYFDFVRSHRRTLFFYWKVGRQQLNGPDMVNQLIIL